MVRTKPKVVTKTEALLELARKAPLRAGDLEAGGIPRTYLRRLCDRGLLERVDRGLYRLPDAPVTELHSLAEVSKRVPHAIVCLLSALQVHGLTTEAPRAVWVLIDRKARTPGLTYPTLEVVRASGAARSFGVEKRSVEGVEVRVTSPAKTVADCFRYRRRVGLDVALAALRDFIRTSRSRTMRRASGNAAGEQEEWAETDAAGYRVDRLIDAARAARVYSVMQPYIEALAS